MDQLEAMHLVLPLLCLHKLDPGNDAADGQEKDQPGDCEPHRCVHVLLHEHEFEVADEAVDERRR